jgi:outer membrane protein assembly factor BamB
VGNGKVYVGSMTGKFHVVDAASGAIVKEYDAGSPIYTSPLLLASGVYFGGFDAKLHALDTDGNLKWTYQAQTNLIHSACAAGDTILIVDGNSHMHWLMDGGSAPAVIRDSMETFGSSSTTFMNSPMVWNGKIYAARGHGELNTNIHKLCRYDFFTGAYESTLGPGASVRCVPSVDTGTGVIFCGSAWDGLDAIAGGWTTTSYYARYPAGLYGVNSSPAVLANCVVFGSEHSADTGGCAVHFFDKAGARYEGTRLWSYRPASGRPLCSSPAVSDGRVVIGSTDGCLYGFWDGAEVTEPVVVDDGSTHTGNRPAARAGAWTLSIFPNPSRGPVNLRIGGTGISTSLKLYDIRGGLVRSFGADDFSNSSLQWDARDRHGRPLASGHYLAVARDRSGKQARRFNLQILR